MSADQVSPELKYDFCSQNTFYWKDKSHLPAFPSSCTHSSVPIYPAGSVFFNSIAKELPNISLGVTKWRHKRVVSLRQNNRWHKYEMKSSKWGRNFAEKAQVEPESSVQSKPNSLMDTFKEKHRRLGVGGVYSWNIIFRPGSQIQERWWQIRPLCEEKPSVWLKYLLVQDLESMTCKSQKKLKYSV